MVQYNDPDDVDKFLMDIKNMDPQEKITELESVIRSEFRTLLFTYSQSSRQVEYLDQENRKLSILIRDLQKELSRLKKQSDPDSQLSKINDLETKLESIKNEKLKLQEDIGNKQKKIDQWENDFKELSSKVALSGTDVNIDIIQTTKIINKQQFDARQVSAERVLDDIAKNEQPLKQIIGEQDYDDFKEYLKKFGTAKDNKEITKLIENNKEGLLKRIGKHWKKVEPYVKTAAKVAGFIGLLL